MKYVQLEIVGLSVSQTQSGAYALILEDIETKRRIPIVVGPVEAQSIAIQLEKLTPPRPLAHDLFFSMTQAFDIIIQEVVIYRLNEGVFFAKLVCVREDQCIEVDSRTSDAIALSLRFGCHIYTTLEILNKAGILTQSSSSSEKKETSTHNKSGSNDDNNDDGEYSYLTIEELHEILTESIAEEAYEKASKVRDVIEKRQSKH